MCTLLEMHHQNHIFFVFAECLSEKFDPNKKSDDEKDSSNGTHGNTI